MPRLQSLPLPGSAHKRDAEHVARELKPWQVAAHLSGHGRRRTLPKHNRVPVQEHIAPGASRIPRLHRHLQSSDVHSLYCNQILLWKGQLEVVMLQLCRQSAQ